MLLKMLFKDNINSNIEMSLTKISELITSEMIYSYNSANVQPLCLATGNCTRNCAVGCASPTLQIV